MVASLFLLLLLVFHIAVGDGFARIAGVGCLALWMALDPIDDRRIKIFLCSSLLLIVTVSVTIVLALLHPPDPLRYDLYLHALDHGLGFCAPQLLFSLLKSCPWLAHLTLGVYQLLPAMMVAGYGWALYSSSNANALLRCYILSSVSAWLYWIVPAAGPGFLLGPALASPHAISQVATIQLPYAANCIPSMHLSSAILVWFFSRNHAVGRRLSAFYVLLTVWTTLSLGQHYLIDLVVAGPFVVFVISASLGKYAKAGAAFALVIAWLLSIRFGIQILLAHSALTWSAAAVTVLLAAKYFLLEGVNGRRVVSPIQKAAARVA